MTSSAFNSNIEEIIEDFIVISGLDLHSYVFLDNNFAICL